MSDTLADSMELDEIEAGFDKTPAGPTCERCEAPLPNDDMSACPTCGWYASLGIHVDIAPEWESACSGQPSTAPAKGFFEVWGGLIPAWGWALLGTSVLVVAASVGVRVYTAEDESLRMIWSVCQLLIGSVLFVTTHLLAFFMVASTDPDMGVMDLVVSPLKGWFRTFRKLPERFWVVNSANASLTACVCAFLVIGALPYEAIWDWGFKTPAKKELLSAIAEKAGGQDNNMNMEEAMGSFAKNAGVNGDLPAPSKGSDAAGGPVERQEIDALIIGYQLAQDGSIDRFLVATEHNGKLYYAGRVRPTLSEEAAAELPARLSAAHSPRPFVTVPGSATWVKPIFTCRVTFERRVESGMLQGIMWEDMLGEVKLGR